MNDLIHLVKTAGPKMVPFIKAVIVYFVLVTFEPKGELWTTIVKCAPIICLMLFIILDGFSLKKEHSYSQRIFLGLIFSCIGDVYLNHEDFFVHGMLAFAIAQLSYISAFGFSPIKPWIGVGFYLFAISYVSLIFNTLDEILTIGVPIYAFCISTMAWRSLAKATHNPDIVNVLCAIGSIMFIISDGCIGVDRFITPISNVRMYVMTTYYAAQFAITLSVVNQKKVKSYSPVASKKRVQSGGSSVSSKKIK